MGVPFALPLTQHYFRLSFLIVFSKKDISKVVKSFGRDLGDSLGGSPHFSCPLGGTICKMTFFVIVSI